MAVLIGLPLLALGQWRSPRVVGEVTGEVIVYPPDGGMRITLGGERVDVNVTNPTLEVTGIAGARVAIEGPVTATIDGTPTFSLTPETLSLLAGQRNCSYTPLNNPLLDAGVTILIRRVTGQTAVDLEAHDFGSLVDFVSCFPGTFDAGPRANCLIGDGGVGYALHNHGEVSWDITDATEVSCTACVHGSNVSQQRAVMAGGVVSCVPAF